MLRPLHYSIKAFLLAICYVLTAPPLTVIAAQVTLGWDANTPTPNGYNIYQRIEGQPYDYSMPVNSSGITGTTYTVNGLTEGTTYHFVVRAFVGSQESGNSKEATHTVPVSVADSDNDGYNDSIDAFPNDPTEWIDTDSDGVGNNADTDDDGDGMPDSWESLYGLDPLDSSDADGDLDGDGTSNIDEYHNNTNPSFRPAGIHSCHYPAYSGEVISTCQVLWLLFKPNAWGSEETGFGCSEA